MVTKFIILGIFLFILAYVAYLSYKRVDNYQDYNLAGKNTGLFALTATLVAAEFNTATLIGGASVAYLFGTVGVWYTSLIFIPVFLVYALTVSKRYRRLNIATVPEYFEKRFGNKELGAQTRVASTIITLFYTWFAPASYLAGISVIGSVLLGVNPIMFSVVIVIICLLLSLAGGLMTAIGLDIVAFIMIIIGMPVIFFIGLDAAGGFANLSQVYEPKLLSLKPVWDTEVNFPIALTWGLQITFLYIASPWYGQRIFSAKNENVAFKGMIINTVLVTLLYAFVVVATMFARVAMPDLAKPEEALPMLIANYSHPIIQGLLLVTLILVGTSTMIALWNSGISTIMNDIVRRYILKNKSEQYYINVSRIGLLIMAISTIIFGIAFVGNIQNSLLYLSVFIGMVSIPIIMSIYWKRYNAKAALVSMIIGLIYCSIGLANGFPTYFISPVAVVIVVLSGVIVTITTTEKGTNNNPKFFKIANGEKEERAEVQTKEKLA